jgi:hypothetical protein
MLVGKGQLSAELQIPHTAGPLRVVVDLTARQITVSTELDAPKDGRSRGRVGWLMRQLSKAPPEITVEARISRSSSTLAGILGALRDDATPLLPDPTREIRGFRVTLTRDLGMNRMAGRGSFIDGVLEAVTVYYRDVLQHLSAWHARPPKLRTDQGPIESEQADVPEEIESAITAAEAEATGEATA